MRFGANVWAGLCISALLFSSSARAEELRIGAGAAPADKIFSRIQGPLEKDTGIKLVIIGGALQEATAELDKGTVQAACAALTFGDWMKALREKGYLAAAEKEYRYRVIGKDFIRVIVNKKAAVKKLSKEQLKGIFTGRITKWKEVGGPDLPIAVVHGTQLIGTNTVFRKQVMDEESYGKGLDVATAADVKAKVSSTPGAIGLSPGVPEGGSADVPEIPEVGRPITLVTRGEPSPSVIKMLEYIKGEGKKYIAE